MICGSRTEKFGEIKYEKKEVVTFLEGFLGFESLRTFIFIDKEEHHPFVWIQSIEDASVSFVALNPYLFYPDYLQTHLLEQRHHNCKLPLIIKMGIA